MGSHHVRLRSDRASLVSLCPIFDRSKTGRKNRQPALVLRQSSFIVEWLYRSILYVIPIRTHDVGMGRRLVRLRADEASLVSLCPIFDRSKTGRKNPRGGARCGWTVTALRTTNQNSLLRRSDSDSYTVPALRFGPETPYRPRPRGQTAKCFCFIGGSVRIPLPARSRTVIPTC